MTKQHFEHAAEMVRDMTASGTYTAAELEAVETAFARFFARWNGRFRPDQFEAACHGEDYEGSTYSGRPLTRRYSQAARDGR